MSRDITEIVNAEKLHRLLQLEGFADEEELAVAATFGNRAGFPGICMNPGCEYTNDVEPDSKSGWCETCETNTVRSGMDLAGLI